MDPLAVFKQRLHRYSPITIPSHLRECLSKNRALTIDMVLYDMKINPKYKHHWRFATLAQVIPVEDLILNNIFPATSTTKSDLHLPEVYKMKITIDTILKTHTLVQYDYSRLVQHPNITIEDILAHPELPWNYLYIYNNPNLKFHHMPLIKHLVPNDIHIPCMTNAFYTLSRNATFEQITNHPHKTWYPIALSSPHIHKEHFPTLLAYFRDQYDIRTKPSTFLLNESFANPNLTFQDFLELFGDIVFRYFWYFKNFTLQDFHTYKSHPSVQWHYPDFGHILPLDTILAHPDTKWDYYKILEQNNTLTYEQVTTTPIPLRCPIPDPTLAQWRVKRHLFENKNIPHIDKKRLLEELLQSIETSYNALDFDCLFQSPLFLEPTFQEIQHHFAKKKIIRHIVETLTNPQYLQCRKRLLREHNTMAYLRA
jgi:hypothetical protein